MNAEGNAAIRLQSAIQTRHAAVRVLNMREPHTLSPELKLTPMVSLSLILGGSKVRMGFQSKWWNSLNAANEGGGSAASGQSFRAM